MPKWEDLELAPDSDEEEYEDDDDDEVESLYDPELDEAGNYIEEYVATDPKEMYDAVKMFNTQT